LGFFTTSSVAASETFELVVIDSQSRAVGVSGRFAHAIGDAPVLELPHEFSVDDPGEAGRRLLDDIARALGTVIG
jgi:hypothetical protein